MSADATVTIKLSEWERAKRETQSAQTRAHELQQQIEEIRKEDPDGRIRAVEGTLSAALEICQSAIANLDPLTVRGLPAQAFYTLAEGLANAPAIPEPLRELSATVRMFADRVNRWETARANGTEQEELAAENAVRGGIAPGAGVEAEA